MYAHMHACGNPIYNNLLLGMPQPGTPSCGKPPCRGVQTVELKGLGVGNASFRQILGFRV